MSRDSLEKNLTVIEILQKEIDRISSIAWADDDCPPKFIVSVYKNKAIITCCHGINVSEDLFPQINMIYGDSEVLEIMTGLYNRTM